MSRGRGARAAGKIALAVGLALGLLELLGAVALKIHLGRVPSLAGLRAERARLVGPAAPVREEVPHPYLGYVLDPIANTPSFIDFHGGFKVNEFGFVDSGSPIHVPEPNETIVGLTGGSLAFFLSTRAFKALEAALGSAPRLRGRKITFVRLAMGGYKEPQQLMVLNYLLTQGAHFDLFINLDGFNEVALPPHDLLPAGTNPSYPRTWPIFASGLSLGEHTMIAARLFELKARRSRWAAWMGLPVLAPSYFANALWKMADDLAARSIVAGEQAMLVVDQDRGSYVVTGPPSHFNGASEVVESVIPTWKRSSLQLERLCRANGIRYFQFLQPNQYDSGSKPIGGAEASVAVRRGHPYAMGVQLGYPKLREAGLELRRQGVAFTDLSRMFIDHPEPLYQDDCCHLNGRGYTLLAQAIGRSVAEQLQKIR